MSNKPRKKKKRDPRKIVKRLTSTFRLESWESWREDGQEVAKGFLNGKLAPAKTYEYVNSMARDWRVRVFVKCMTPDNEKYIEESEIVARSCKLEDLEDIFKRVKRETKDAVNPKHIYNTGFIAETIN